MLNQNKIRKISSFLDILPTRTSFKTELCLICNDALDSRSKVLLCLHSYHRNCIGRWFYKKAECPCCKQNQIKLYRKNEKILDLNNLNCL